MGRVALPLCSILVSHACLFFFPGLFYEQVAADLVNGRSGSWSKKEKMQLIIKMK